jgi:transposase InsO family protein
LLKLSGLPRSTYYYYILTNDKPDKYAKVKKRIKEIYHQNKGRYGYRRILCCLRNEKVIINHKTVQKLMKELKLCCKVRLKKYKSYKGEVGRIAQNILNRNFKATKPHEKMVTDITEFSLFNEKIYFTSLMDLYNGEIVGYNVSASPNFAFVREMTEAALTKIKNPKGVIIHSDQGWHYQMKAYQRILANKGIVHSMSRKGNCLDNAVIENFFGHLKSELL